MTFQDPGGNPAPGGRDDDPTRADWDLAQLDSLVGSGAQGREPTMPQPLTPPPGPPAGPPPAPSGPQAWSGAAPGGAPPVSPGYGQGPGVAPGYAPGMAWEPPAAYGDPSGPGGGIEYAGVGARFVAWFIDTIILAVIGIGLSLVVTLVILGSMDWTFMVQTGRTGYAFDEGFLARATIVSLVVSAIGLAINLGYFALQWSSGARATIGMRALGLQIGSAVDGQTLPRGRAAKRWLAMGSWVGLLGAFGPLSGLVALGQFLWSLVLLITTASNPRRQGLHDQFAGTAIVQPAGRDNSSVVIGCVVLAVLVLVVLPIIAIVALISLGGQVSDILSRVGESI